MFNRIFIALFTALLIGQITLAATPLKSSEEIAIVDVKTTDSDFVGDGNFNESKLASIVSQALKAKNKAFSNDKCLSIKNLGKGGGYNTLQLFLLSSTCDGQRSSYIIKEPRDGMSEIKNMNMILKSPKLKELALPNIKPGFPSLALPIGYISYTKDNKKSYLIIMPLAPGTSLNNLISNYRNDKSAANKELLSQAFKKLGEETANFYKQNKVASKDDILGKTITHGDFHLFNIFYDSTKNHFTYIDNESIANSINKPIDISTDMVKLFFMPFSLNADYKQFHDLVAGIDLKTWYNISLKNFIIGFLSVYPKTEQAKVLLALQKLFTSPFTPIPWVDFNDEELKGMRTKYIMPIFDELRKKLT